MNVLRQALADYLAVRRALGYRLARAEKLLAQFLAFVEHRGEEHLTIETALAWATAPAGADPNWMSRRLSDVRRFPSICAGSTPLPRCRRRISCQVDHAEQRRTCTRRKRSPP